MNKTKALKNENNETYEQEKLSENDGMVMLSNGLPEYVPPPPPPPVRPMFELEYLQHPFGLAELRPSDMTTISNQQSVLPTYVQTLQRYSKDSINYTIENENEVFNTLRPRYTGSGLDQHIITTPSNISSLKVINGSIQNVHYNLNGPQTETNI